jgi:hypothetical protein
MLRFYEYFPQAVHEGGNPQEPLEEGRQHDHTDDGSVNDLRMNALAPIASFHHEIAGSIHR